MPTPKQDYPAKKAMHVIVTDFDEKPEIMKKALASVNATSVTVNMGNKNHPFGSKKTLLQALELNGYIKAFADAGVKALYFDKCMNVGFPQSPMLYRNIEMITVYSNYALAVSIDDNREYYNQRVKEVNANLKIAGNCIFNLTAPIEQLSMQLT